MRAACVFPCMYCYWLESDLCTDTRISQKIYHMVCSLDLLRFYSRIISEVDLWIILGVNILLG